MMPNRLALAAALALATVSTPGSAQESVVVDHVLGPEGPLVVDGKLYYVSWNPGSLMRWDGKSSEILNDAQGCSHNGLALTERSTLLLACSLSPGAILELGLDGKELRRWSTDDQGRPFDGGINDVVATPDGGAYATIFGPFAEQPSTIMGAVLYKSPGSANWTRVAENLNYANGIAVSPDQRTLYVAEMVGNSIVKFDIAPDGTLANRANFVRLDLLLPNKAAKWWAGPDSMKADGDGNLYVAQFYGGRILKISPEGELLHVFEISAGNGTTNVAFSDDRMKLFVTVVTNGNEVAGDAPGSIVEIPNAN